MGQRIRERAKRDGQEVDVHVRTDPLPWHVRLRDMLKPKNVVVLSRPNSNQSADDTTSGSDQQHRGGSKQTSNSNRLRPDMIRRMDNAPQLINPSGWISEGHSAPTRPTTLERASTEPASKQLAFSLGDTLTASPDAIEEPLPPKASMDSGLLR
jgi:hypothetical protein